MPDESPASSAYSLASVLSLPADQLRELARLTTPKVSRWVPHQPTVPQAAFLLLDGREALYGGAAGGGKSDALLMAALQYVDVPDYAAILFRRTYKDLSLPEALMDRAASWLRGTAARWNENEKTWRFPSGARLAFGYLETEKDKYRYQGAAFQFIGFDELTQFVESQYRYLFSRLRRLAGSLIPLRMRAASNPGGEGHEWVKQRFLVEGRINGRVFVPAKLEDNPHLDRADYEQSLKELDPVTRQRLRDGDWGAREPGGYFDRTWFEMVDAAPSFLIRWHRHWDLAGTEPNSENTDPDWTVGVKLGWARGRFWVGDVRRARVNPGKVEELVEATAQADGTECTVSMEQEPGASGKSLIHHYAAKVLKGYAFRGIPASKDKETRCKPVSAAAFNRLVSVVRAPWNGPFFDCLEAFPAGAHDDDVDALSGAHKALSGLAKDEKPPPRETRKGLRDESL